MPEEPAAPPAGGQNNQPTPPAGDKPANQPGGGDQTVDFSKMSDEQLTKALEDPRIWNTPRLKELRDAQKQLKTFQTAEEKRKSDELAAKGEFEKLSQQNEARATAAEQKYEKSVTDNAILVEAAKLGVTDLEAAKLLINRDKVVFDKETGTVTGVEEAVKALVAQRAYLVGKSTQPPVGGGTNPANPNSEYDFTMTQISNPIFYQANRDAIMRAQSAGRIKEDRI